MTTNDENGTPPAADEKPNETEMVAEAPDESPPIPRSISTKRLAALIAGLLVTLWLGALIGPPIGAGLHKVWSTVAGSHEAESGGEQHYYTCGMHPWVIEPKPGNCPICGMKLVPLDPAKFSGQVTIDPVVSQNIGVRVEKVGEGSEGGSIRTVGTVTYDETLLGDVNLKVSGWIEKLYVDYLGAPVKRGQALFSIYSPDLYAAQAEYLLAQKATQHSSSTAGSSTLNLAGELLEPARTKLNLFDVGAGQIKALEKRGKPFKNMTISSPQSGVIIEKNAFEGMKVTPGMTAFRIADLSRIWVMATVYEYQSRDIKVGQMATMELTYLPGQTFEGKVVYIYPFLEEHTRQIKVRLEFDNKDSKLKPGMYATVTFQGTTVDKRILVSRSAVIDTGQRQVAFVARGQGKFEPRAVHMGAETDDGKVEILDGLKPGELVVVSGQFLIDSEARMREALAKMMKGTPVAEATAPKAPSVESAVVVLPDAASSALGAAIAAYLAVGRALAGDTTTNIGVSARKLADAIDALVAMPVPGKPDFWKKLSAADAVKREALALGKPSSLADTRKSFATLSSALSELLHATGVPKSYDKKLEDSHCPMYPAGSKEGSVWIQEAGPAQNPYFGKAMLTCSDWQRPLQVAP
jgi:membrane fusion protein, copper/silver efflux system